jgi:hypothetical protein
VWREHGANMDKINPMLAAINRRRKKQEELKQLKEQDQGQSQEQVKHQHL